MIRISFQAVLAAVLWPVAAASATADRAADAVWIEKCVGQLAQEHADIRTRQTYCTCMHGFFEDNQPVTQTEMERMFPPAHRMCHQAAGWK